VTGITAIVVGALLATGRAGVRTARAWKVTGALLLVNIIVIYRRLRRPRLTHRK
jgi:hypothetical protein